METSGALVQSNVEILDVIRENASTVYQSRVPDATKAGIADTVSAMWNYAPTRNEFIDTLINQIGLIIIRDTTWQNPLAKFKRGLLTDGDTIEEIETGLLEAYTYDPKREYLEKAIFGTYENEVQSRFYKINRQNYYPLSVKEVLLRRAFNAAGGLTSFLQKLLAQPSTSDQWDEYLIMSSLFQTAYDADGFFKVNVPDIGSSGSTADDAKFMLREARTLAEKLTFLSRDYNPAHMPVVAQPDQLELFLTPEVDAAMDVEALAAAFNIDKMQIGSRKTIVRQEDVKIPGFQGLLTTRDWFVCADTFMEMRNSQNPVALQQNFFWHHHQIHAISPFVPSILFTSEDDGTAITVIDYRVDGISAFTIADANADTVTDATVTRGDIYQVSAAATTSPVGGPNTAVRYSITGNQSPRTYITQTGILKIGEDEQASTIQVRATAVSDGSFTEVTALTVAGDLVTVTIGAAVDTTPSALSNRRLPSINPNTGGVGTTFVASNGTWDRQADSYTYQWKKAGVAISGATADTYTAVSGDAGAALTVAVTAVKSGYTSGTAESKSVTVAA